jgi:hypothetical protein
MQNVGESETLQVPVKELRRGQIVQDITIHTPNPWSLKVKVDLNNQLGIFFCNKRSNEENHRSNVDRIKKGREFFNFLTGIYNFQIEDNTLVYDVCGIFAFPRDWNFLYGPSKLADTDKIKEEVRSGILHIRCWLYEGILHSALLHYIAANIQNVIESATKEDFISLPAKDLYSLLGSEDLNLANEDLLLCFLQEYAKYHLSNCMNDLLKGIKVARVSTRCLIESLACPSIRTDEQFYTRVSSELEFRSRL